MSALGTPPFWWLAAALHTQPAPGSASQHGALCFPQIVQTYDIAVVQEVRDSDRSAIRKLMDQASLQPYSYVVSEPLGRTSYKEQYLFIYRTDMVSVVDSYYYDDGCEPCGSDTFSREPFIVKFSSPFTEVQEFVLVPLHTPPSEAVAEIDTLYDVYLDVIDKWGTDNILFLGDFNADCSYVGPQDWPSIRLRTSDAFQWLIPDSADTTVSYTDCAYDREAAELPHQQRCRVTPPAALPLLALGSSLALGRARAFPAGCNREAQLPEKSSV
uniref:Deoxyribonuclease 1 n=1 Tax=Terrapene triunguis TaxID=2587831 RepID=A0A674I7N5_9SAUR